MSTTAPMDRMAPARAAKAQQLAERKRLEELEKLKQQRKEQPPPMEEEMESWSESSEEVPPPKPRKRQREISVEPFYSEPTPPPKKKKHVTFAEPVASDLGVRQHAVNFLYGALPVVGQLALLVGGVVCSIAMRTTVETRHPNVPHNNSTMLETPAYVPPSVPRSHHPDDYSLF